MVIEPRKSNYFPFNIWETKLFDSIEIRMNFTILTLSPNSKIYFYSKHKSNCCLDMR